MSFPLFSLDKRLALITGSGSGIGSPASPLPDTVA